MTYHPPPPPPGAPERCQRPDGTTKATFRSPAKAKQAIRRQRGNAGVPLYVYQCRHCGFWHHTSQPQRKDGTS